MPKRKIIRVGVDLDGVIAQHALGGFWVWLRKLKEKILKRATWRNYYYPSTIFERIGWRVINWLRRPFCDKNGLFTSLAKQKGVEFYLVTSRFKFLEKLTKKWLKKHDLDRFFHQIHLNVKDFDPFEFKARAIEDLRLDFFIDDDLEAINYLRQKTMANFYWIAPDYRKKTDSRDSRIETCEDLVEALRRIFGS